MMSLTQAQADFAQAISVLIGAAVLVHGGIYRVRLDWGYRDEEANRRVGGHPRSLHKDRLAQDVTVYVMRVDGSLDIPSVAETAAVLETLHNIWDALGGAARIAGDLGHFSWIWGTVR